MKFATFFVTVVLMAGPCFLHAQSGTMAVSSGVGTTTAAHWWTGGGADSANFPNPNHKLLLDYGTYDCPSNIYYTNTWSAMQYDSTYATPSVYTGCLPGSVTEKFIWFPNHASLMEWLRNYQPPVVYGVVVPAREIPVKIEEKQEEVPQPPKQETVRHYQVEEK